MRSFVVHYKQENTLYAVSKWVANSQILNAVLKWVIMDVFHNDTVMGSSERA